MAELSITCPSQTTGNTGGGGAIGIEKISLIRIGGCFEANTPFDINNPGLDWAVFGGPVLISGSQEFVEQIQTYKNGILQLPGESSSDDFDVYFVSASGTIAFESNIQTHDVVQVWHYTTASG